MKELVVITKENELFDFIKFIWGNENKSRFIRYKGKRYHAVLYYDYAIVLNCRRPDYIDEFFLIDGAYWDYD